MRDFRRMMAFIAQRAGGGEEHDYFLLLTNLSNACHMCPACASSRSPPLPLGPVGLGRTYIGFFSMSISARTHVVLRLAKIHQRLTVPSTVQMVHHNNSSPVFYNRRNRSLDWLC